MTDTPMKMHGDHIATCICCKHIYFFEGSMYSDVSPGDGTEFACLRDRFITNIVAGLHDTMKTAQTCPDFEGEP